MVTIHTMETIAMISPDIQDMDCNSKDGTKHSFLLVSFVFFFTVWPDLITMYGCTVYGSCSLAVQYLISLKLQKTHPKPSPDT